MIENQKYMYLYGAGGHAKVILDILNEKNINVLKIFDRDKSISRFMNIPVEHDKAESPLIISIGDNRVRKRIVLELSGTDYCTAISNSAIVSNSSKIGEGSVVMQGVIIQSSVSVGKHAIINTGSTIDHDCKINDYVHIAPGCNLCGNVSVGEGTIVGVGSVIIPGIKIGKWCVIGAGSVVTKDIPDNVVAVGNPCRIIKK